LVIFRRIEFADDIAYAGSSASFTIQLVELRQLSYFVFSPWVRCNAAPRWRSRASDY